MCGAFAVPSCLFSHENSSLVCLNNLKICQVVSVASFLFRFKLFEERVVQRSQVFVNEEVTVHLRNIDAQLFFGSEQEYFKSVMRYCDHQRVWLRQFGNIHLVIDFCGFAY